MTAFADALVSDLVLKAVDTAQSSLRSDRTIRAVRLCFTDNRWNVTWLIFEQAQVTNAGRGQESGIHVYTNDIDLLTGQPPSFSAKGTWNDVDVLIEAATDFLASKLSTATTVRLFVQTDLESGTWIPNLEADSENGFDAIHVQDYLLGI